MTDVFNSPNDPLFFMHHSNLDRVWALWQEQDPLNRLHDIGPKPWFDFSPISMNMVLQMGVFAPDKKVSEVFDTQNRDGRGILCYKYEGLPIERYLD
jgi:tyrosinase